MGSAIDLKEINRFEVTEVYKHPDAKVDIVLVHGLNGHPLNTWSAKNGVFWPSQLLPTALKSVQARVLVYGWNSTVASFGSGIGPSTDMIHQHAQSLLTSLSLERKSEERGQAPIIWVGHSLGGILIKRALELSHDLAGKNSDDLRSIYVSSYGIMFLGTPHNGADPAKWGLILQSIVSATIPKKFMESQSQLIRTLQSNNETLQNINLKFLDIYPNHLQICMVHESHATDLKFSKAMVVDQLSAGPLLPDVTYFGIEQTHSGMCKFESKNAPGFTNVSMTIKSWASEAPSAVTRYWSDEMMARRQKDESEMDKLKSKYQQSPGITVQPPSNEPKAPDPTSSIENSTFIVPLIPDIKREIMHASQPSSPTHSSDEEHESYFIKPLGFRPNSIFVGRQTEIAEMHSMLFDKRKREEGTSAVLLQSIPGGGKTHLARQYVYEHKDDFPGGIFWIRAKSQAELASGYWDIARKAALTDLTRASEELRNDPQQFIRLVRKWLNHRRDWLLVLDGIRFTDAITKFIPDSKSTSLIYTSTERSVVGDHHFMNPQIIRLSQLSAREGQRLLLLELDKKEPFSGGDLRYSMELVQSMGFLPVVIHSVAQRLKATNEPLSRFAKHYSSEPRLRGLGTFVAVVEQLKEIGAEEALNLIYLLCFFSQYVPVEMISLGLRVLDVPVKALEPVIGRHINNTFKILSKFALIDRNELNPVQSSQSSKASRDMLIENIDVIRLHGVVQGFFVDTLAADRTLPVWLDRAIRVFCCAYDLANERIMRKANAGLVEDFRMFEVHGNKLRDHLSKFFAKHITPEHREILLAAQEMLWMRLESIRIEIEERTPESSQIIAANKAETFQTSIFDRTSSSSDTGPETPGAPEIPHHSVSTWGLELERAQHESPSNLVHDTDFPKNIRDHRNEFHLSVPEDPGYESDRDDSATVIPQYTTTRQSNEAASQGDWQELLPRRPRRRPEPLPLHRTIRSLERSRYSDSAGAYRSLSAVDPRLSTESAQGFLLGNGPRSKSRGRMSGRSSAEVALTHITTSSPPPARGGGMIQDRRTTSQKPALKGRMLTGISTYAAAVSSPTTEPYFGPGLLPQPVKPITPSRMDTQDHESPLSSAMLSLQKFPVEVDRDSTTHIVPSTLRPPYPQTPYNNIDSDPMIFQMPGNYGQENISLDPSNIYPPMEGLLPVEKTYLSALASRDIDHDVPAMLSGSLPSLMLPYHPQQTQNSLSNSSLSIRLSHQESDISPYFPGRPELSNQGGYSSQPMTRGPSGEYEHTAKSADLLGRRRRPSAAETEPIPQLPTFSPRIAPTSYEVYERMRERNMLLGYGTREADLQAVRRERARRAVERKSPRLEFARAALIDRMEDWENAPPTSTRRAFNPSAPSFSPSQPSYENSAALPHGPTNSIMTSFYPAASTSLGTSTYPPPFMYHPNTTSASFPPPQKSGDTLLPFSSNLANHNPRSLSLSEGSRERTPRTNELRLSMTSAPDLAQELDGSGKRGTSATGGEEMDRNGSTGSGGVMIGGTLIEFGDYPQPVDYVLARERAMKSWSESERDVERRRIDVRSANDDEGDALVGLGLGVGAEIGK